MADGVEARPDWPEHVARPEDTYVVVAPPRSASTALARILWHHETVRFYAHEPYGAAYHDGAGPEAAGEALRHPADLVVTIGDKPAGARGFVVKEMTFQVGRSFPGLAARTAWPIVFNVRDPRLCVASRMAMRRQQGLPEVFPANESGWQDLADQVRWCRDEGVAYRVVDATVLRGQPLLVASKVLDALGLEFHESVLHWTPVRSETVQAVAAQDHWYRRVLSADRIEAAEETVPELASFPAELGWRDHVAWCCDTYRSLLADPHVIGTGP